MTGPERQDHAQARIDPRRRDVVDRNGRLAKQASGSVFVRYGDTVVLVTACYAPSQREGIDFLP